jgi:hypothetical protein
MMIKIGGHWEVPLIDEIVCSWGALVKMFTLRVLTDGPNPLPNTGREGSSSRAAFDT